MIVQQAGSWCGGTPLTSVTFLFAQISYYIILEYIYDKLGNAQKTRLRTSDISRAPQMPWKPTTCGQGALHQSLLANNQLGENELCRLFLLKRLVANLKFCERFRRASAITAAASANASS